MEAATGARNLPSDRISTAVHIVAGVLGAGYVTAGIVGPALDAPGSGSDLFWWLALLVGGGVLVLTGAFVLASRPVVAAVVTIPGAIAGALAIFWSVVVPVLALVLVVLCIARARRVSEGGRSVSRA